MRHLIIGMGEVGRALKEIFPDASTYDEKLPMMNDITEYPYDIMHICFPYSEQFVESVFSYKLRFRAQITIIHSSVEVGTSDRLKAVYSPIRGVHPNLERGIRTLVKYFAGLKAYDAARPFRDAGIPCRIIASTRTLEAAKLWDTTVYGMQILIEKEIWEWCKKYEVDFEVVYRDFTRTYNEGYERLDMSHVVRPWLLHEDGKIGGHCVIANAELLGSDMAKVILKANDKL